MQQKNPSVGSAPFSLLLRVRYGECDAQQVVFNARYADYIDIAMTEYFRATLGSFQALLDKGLDNQVVSLNIDWKTSAKFDEVLAMTVISESVGNTSFSFKVMINNYASKKLIATSRITYVMVDTQHYRKTQIPDWLRSILFSTSSLPIVNHAGVPDENI